MFIKDRKSMQFNNLPIWELKDYLTGFITGSRDGAKGTIDLADNEIRDTYLEGYCDGFKEGFGVRILTSSQPTAPVQEVQ